MKATPPAPVLLRESCASGVILLRINRPQVRNALDLELRRALAAEFVDLATQDDVRCIVITGDDRAFSAGADLREYVDASPVEIMERQMDRLWGAIASCPKPVIAAVRGHALGGGCELAMHADIIIAGESARFGQPEVKIGLIPGGGATQRLTRAVGKFAAMKMLLSGCPVAADEAKVLGLVSEVVPDADVLPTALELAREIATYPPLAVRQVKELVLASMSVPLDMGLNLERKAFQLMFSTHEKTDRIRAFLKVR
jgi:enoyl-CoA hydratase